MPALLRPGGVLTITGTARVGDVLTDPDDATLTVRAPDGAETAYVYGTDVEVVKDTTGTFHADIAVTAGMWAWEWEFTGPAAGVDQGTFSVELSLLTVPGYCSLDDIHLVRQDATAGLRDDLIMALIARASAYYERFTGRQFTLDATASDRYFPMQGASRDRVVLIDDLSAAPTEVEVLNADGDSVAVLVVATDVVSLPRNRRGLFPVTALRLHSSVAVSDTYELRVKGVWGWPSVPDDVREAVIEMVVDWMKNHQGLTTQSPDAFAPGEPPQRAMPLKSLDIARRYRTPPIA